MNLALTLAVLLAAQSGAGRSRPPLSAVKLLDRGQAEFNRGEFQASLRTLDAAADGAREDGLMARIHLLRGQVFAAQQRTERAEEAFTETLRYDPEASLDPQRVDPAVVRLLSRVRERLRGQLRVRADANAGRVYLNGKPIGQLPYSGEQPIGRHRLEVRSTDGRRATREVLLAANRVVEIDLALAVPEVVVTPDPAQKDELAPEPTAVEQLHAAGGRLVLDARLGIEPGMAEWFGLELGVGAEVKRWRVLLDARFSPTDPGLWGLTARGQLRVPVSQKVTVYGAGELPVFFTPYAAAGIGGGVGGEYKINPWLSGFGEGGVRYFFNGRAPFQQFRVGVTFGVLFGLGK